LVVVYTCGLSVLLSLTITRTPLPAPAIPDPLSSVLVSPLRPRRRDKMKIDYHLKCVKWFGAVVVDSSR
jgi:hypothetical protein